MAGLFINADPGFDSQKLRRLFQNKDMIATFCFNKRNGQDNDDIYFDEKLYEERFVIETTNAWLDSYRTLFTRFDATVSSWKAWNFMAFIVLGIKKFEKNKKSR